MRTVRRAWVGLVAAAAVAGCRTPVLLPAAAPPAAPPPPLELATGPANSLEPDYQSLPSLDPLAATAAEIAPPVGYRVLTEDACRREASARATLARVVEQEGGVPSVVSPRSKSVCAALAVDQLLGEVRAALAAEARNRAATQALEVFFQLGDAEGRGDLVRASLPSLDLLRAMVRKARADGLRIPVEPDELDRQRATLLGLIAQAELGEKAFDIELRRRVGLPGQGPDRIRPAGPFPVSDAAIDVDVAVRAALANRADLRLLRTTYLRLSPDTLPVVRDVLRTQPGLAALASRVPTPAGPLADLARSCRSSGADAVVAAEVAVRRQQLFDLIADRERQAADDVRAAAAALTAQTTQVALARWRAESLRKRAADAKGQGPLAELPAEVEAFRARADVVAAVMTWHQARVRFLAAQGTLADEPAPAPAK